MTKAIWNGVVVAESDGTVVVEGNHYFPPAALKRAHFHDNAKSTVCSWKGNASYYDLVVGDSVNPAAAWTYRAPKPEAAHLKDWVAFWNGVEVKA